MNGENYTIEELVTLVMVFRDGHPLANVYEEWVGSTADHEATGAVRFLYWLIDRIYYREKGMLNNERTDIHT